MFRNILVVESSLDKTAQPFLAAIKFSKAFNSGIVDLSVVEPRLFNGSDVRSACDGALVERQRRLAALDLLNEHESMAREAQLTCKAIIVQSSTPSVEIVNVAHRHGCDVIFMQAQKPGGWLEKLLEESQTEGVLMHALVPVMFFP